MKRISLIFTCLILLGIAACVHAEGIVKIGLDYDKTGPYNVQGLDQLQAATMAVEEINAAGGIMGNKIELVIRDCKADVATAKANVVEMIDKEGCKMIFGGSSSGVAVATGDICQDKNVLFFGTLTYSTSTTGEDGHRHTFRECYDSWMAAKALSQYLKTSFPGKKYMYITADYTWGWTTEASMRKFTGTEDKESHKGMLTPLGTTDFAKQLGLAKIVKPDVLVLVLFGEDMVNAIRQATALGLKTQCQIVVPNLTLGMAEGGGPKVMEGVIGALPWAWNVPGQYGFERGKKFVEDFSQRYGRYPCTSGASAYTILYEYKDAVERAKSFESPAVISALENYSYSLLKDAQTWRDFDHQSVQTVYAVKCKPQVEVMKDKYRQDYFQIISSMKGEEAACSKSEWEAVRLAAKKPTTLEPLTTTAMTNE